MVKESKRPNKSLISFDDGRQIHRKVRFLDDGTPYVKIHRELFRVEKRAEKHYHVMGKVRQGV